MRTSYPIWIAQIQLSHLACFLSIPSLGSLCLLTIIASDHCEVKGLQAVLYKTNNRGKLFPAPLKYQGEAAWGLMTSCCENVRVTLKTTCALLFQGEGPLLHCFLCFNGLLSEFRGKQMEYKADYQLSVNKLWVTGKMDTSQSNIPNFSGLINPGCLLNTWLLLSAPPILNQEV